MKKLLPWIFSLLSGSLAFLGYAGFNQFYLEWFFLVPLLWAARNASPGRAFLLGWTAGTVEHAGGFYWIAHMLTTFAGFNPAFSAAGLFLFSVLNGLSFAIFTWAVSRLRLARRWSLWWTAPFVWTAVENVFPFIFPHYIGASQYLLLPLTQIADITGILGISFLLIWCNMTVYIVLESLIERRKIQLKKVAVFLVVIGITAAYGTVRIYQIDAAVKAAPKIKTVIIQAGKGGATKFQDPLSFIRLHQEMSQRAFLEKSADDAELVIWPESVSLYPLSRELKQLPRDLFGNTGKPLLFGTITAEKRNGKIQKYASALLADGHNTILGLYDKRILVPFGEYIPFGDFFPVLYKWLPYTGRFQPGKSPDPLPFGNYRLSLNICYEDLFYGLIRQNMTADISRGKSPPHAIINLTNDSWYGDTIEPLEHLVLASFRSIEHRRALARSTNTGISAIIDPVGRLKKRTGQWTRETLVGEVPMMTGRTIFSHAGNWLGWTATAFVLMLIGLSFKPMKKTEKKRLRKAQRKAKNR